MCPYPYILTSLQKTWHCPGSFPEPNKGECMSSLWGTGEHVQHTWCCFAIHQEICPSISSSSSSSLHLRSTIEAFADLRGLWIKGRGKSKGSPACVPYLSAPRIKNELILPSLANTLLPRSLHLGPVRTHTPPLLSRVHATRLKLWFDFSFFVEHFLDRYCSGQQKKTRIYDSLLLEMATNHELHPKC